jgi:hypothetical protein
MLPSLRAPRFMPLITRTPTIQSLRGTAEPAAPKVPPQQQGASEPAREGAAEPRNKRLWLRLLDRFGTNAPKSEEQRAADIAYRTAREAAFDGVFPELVQSPAPFDELLCRAHKTLNEKKEFSLAVRLSALLLRNTLDAGAYRTGPNRAGDYRAPSARDVQSLMTAFGASMSRLVPQARDEDALLVAAWALTVMIRIHPFADGNGRTARAAMNLVLAKSSHPIIDFPADSEGVYKKSPVWARLKDHMRGFVAELGWTMKDGALPPAGYAEKLATRLHDELATTTIDTLRARPDITAIATALGHARAHGFG